MSDDAGNTGLPDTEHGAGLYDLSSLAGLPVADDWDGESVHKGTDAGERGADPVV